MSALPSKETRKIVVSHSTKSENTSLIKRIQERQTEELVFAVCGPLGSGTSKVAKTIMHIIASEKYNYTPHYINRSFAANTHSFSKTQ